MALETGTYISDLVATNPLGSDLKSQGDDHIRLIKSTLQATFPSVSGVVAPTHTELNYVEGVTSAIQAQLDNKSNRNQIINGDFNIWQRGTSFAAIASGDYSSDRWLYGKTGAMVHTVSQSSDVPTAAQVGRLLNYSLLLDCTTADTSIAAGDLCTISQRIEGYNFLPIAQRDFTLSFWVKGTKTGTHCVAFKNSGNDRSYVAEYTINTTATWEKKTITVPASPTAGTWDYTNGTGLGVVFTLAAGTTFQTTADTWQTGNFIATSNQVNAVDSASNDFRITGVRIEPGDKATLLDAPLFSDELSNCQRYYGSVNTHYRRYDDSFTDGNDGGWVSYPTTPRATPTVSLALEGANVGTLTVGTITKESARFSYVWTSSGVTARDAIVSGTYNAEL